jgi:hypothetical protein
MGPWPPWPFDASPMAAWTQIKSVGRMAAYIGHKITTVLEYSTMRSRERRAPRPQWSQSHMALAIQFQIDAADKIPATAAACCAQAGNASYTTLAQRLHRSAGRIHALGDLRPPPRAASVQRQVSMDQCRGCSIAAALQATPPSRSACRTGPRAPK